MSYVHVSVFIFLPKHYVMFRYIHRHVSTIAYQCYFGSGVTEIEH